MVELPQDLSDEQLIARALDMYANWLETKNPLISRSDALRQAGPIGIQLLNDEQLALVRRLLDLATKYQGLANDKR